MLYEILKNMYPNLLPNLRDDVLKCIMFNTDKHEFKDERIKALSEQDYLEQSPEIANTCIDLLMNIVTIKELIRYCDSMGIDLKFLETLYKCFMNKDNEVMLREDFAFDDSQKIKLIQHQLLQAVNDRKGIN